MKWLKRHWYLEPYLLFLHVPFQNTKVFIIYILYMHIYTYMHIHTHKIQQDPD